MAVSLDVRWLLELGDQNSRLLDTIDTHQLAVPFYVYPYQRQASFKRLVAEQKSVNVRNIHCLLKKFTTSQDAHLG